MPTAPPTKVTVRPALVKPALVEPALVEPALVKPAHVEPALVEPTLVEPGLVKNWPLPYEALLEARDVEQVDLVVIHCTELPDLAMARAYGERVLHGASGTGNCGHWYIDRDGSIACFVRPERVAHHVRGHNTHSVGIELVNTGRYPDWLAAHHQAMDEPYPDAQIDALLVLLADLKALLPNLHWIAGHEELDVERVPATDDPSQTVPRKRDPGPLFPWDRVLASTDLVRLPAEMAP